MPCPAFRLGMAFFVFGGCLERRSVCNLASVVGGGGQRPAIRCPPMSDVKNAVRRTARAAASARGGPQLTLRSSASSAGRDPKPFYTHASARPAAEAISDKGRPQRRSVKNRKSFDCFKSAAGIRFSADAAAAPEIVSPRRFLGYLLSAQKVTYEKNTSCHRA